MTTHHLFVFIGAAPNTAWLETCGVQRDEKGFVLTGADVPDAAPHVPSLQTSLEGVFAIGDVRSGSIKRVASAVGEGAAVVAQIHAVLAGMPRHLPARHALANPLGTPASLGQRAPSECLQYAGRTGRAG